MSTSSQKANTVPSPVVPNSTGLDALRSAFVAADRPYYISGKLPTSNPFSLLVPSVNGYTAVPFPVVSHDSLEPLIKACDQASFGKGNQEVLDPSYRRALGLHADKFGVVPNSVIDPYVLGIIPAIQEALFSSELKGRRIVAKLDKLNVYSTGDFFKAHVDTPRSTDMFGTLLLNLPVSHEGGQFVVRAPKETQPVEGATDAEIVSHEAYTTSWGNNTEISWIAFFSDCEHEVLPVTGGHRVTLSYDLFLDGKEIEKDPVNIETLGGTTDHVRSRLTEEILAPGILGEARPRICFHLKHGYPVDPSVSRASDAVTSLKGRDAILHNALKAAGVGVTLHFVLFPTCAYEKENNVPHYLPDLCLGVGGTADEECGDYDYVRDCGGRKAEELSMTVLNDHGPQISPVTYGTYGNYPSTDTMYASICIIATAKSHVDDGIWGEERGR